MKATMAALALALAAAPLSAQSPAPGTPASPESAAPDVVKSRIDQELAPAPGSYVYNPQGRRDPFISLLKPITETGRRKLPGIEGMLVQEVALKGIVKDAKGYTAMLTGPDVTKSFFIKVGQRLYDGVVIAIDAATVTFRQEVTDPLSSVRSRDVKKTLYPSEEGRQ
jgi:type IV pilus assembly protein PilP